MPDDKLSNRAAWVLVALEAVATAAGVAMMVVMIAADLPRWIAAPVVVYLAVLIGVIVRSRRLIPGRRER